MVRLSRILADPGVQKWRRPWRRPRPRRGPQRRSQVGSRAGAPEGAPRPNSSSIYSSTTRLGLGVGRLGRAARPATAAPSASGSARGVLEVLAEVLRREVRERAEPHADPRHPRRLPRPAPSPRSSGSGRPSGPFRARGHLLRDLASRPPATAPASTAGVSSSPGLEARALDPEDDERAAAAGRAPAPSSTASARPRWCVEVRNSSAGSSRSPASRRCTVPGARARGDGVDEPERVGALERVDQARSARPPRSSTSTPAGSASRRRAAQRSPAASSLRHGFPMPTTLSSARPRASRKCVAHEMHGS